MLVVVCLPQKRLPAWLLAFKDFFLVKAAEKIIRGRKDKYTNVHAEHKLFLVFWGITNVISWE